MKILQNLDFSNQDEKGAAITIGNFDGLHIGHKKLIKTTKKYADENDLLSIVMTFSPHPIELIKNKDFSYILSEKEKEKEMAKENIDIFIKYPFTKELKDTSPEQFINMLIQKTNCKALIVGEDYCFGKNRQGNAYMMQKIGEKLGIKIIIIKNIEKNRQRVSSSIIREYILKGDMENIINILDKAYYVYGKVVEGNKIGRTIGFPTANIIPVDKKILPPDGVYITRTVYNKKVYESITNIGLNPTFGNKYKTIETYIFNTNMNLYGKDIKVMFFKRIRGIFKFSGIDELKGQIEKDKYIAEQYFIKTNE